MASVRPTERGEALLEELFGHVKFWTPSGKGKVRYFIETKLIEWGEPRTRWACRKMLEGAPRFRADRYVRERAFAPLEEWMSPEDLEKLQRPREFILKGTHG